LAFDHYLDRDTGIMLKPEYTTMSRRPGIAAGWFKKFSSDVFPLDEVVLRGKKMRPPKFYDSQYEFEFPDDFERVKKRRVSSARKFSSDNTLERLYVKEEVQRLKLKKLVRNVDLEN
jgi:hypothetical protein